MRKSQSIFLKTKLPAMMELLSPRWSNDCFPDVEKTWTVQFPTAEQIKQIMKGDRKVLNNLQLAVIEYVDWRRFNFTLSNGLTFDQSE